jgi:hypothetical protein
MGRTALKYGAGLIGLYLVVAYATGSGQVIGALTNGSAVVTRALQARG